MTASRSLTGPLILIALLLAMFATPVASASAADGTIKVLKAGDRNPGDNTAGGYAAGLAGAVFEYSTSSSFASIAGTFAPTDATGAATKSVAPGTYYVREKTAPSGWNDMGAIQSLYFDPSSSTPDSARAYESTVVVSSGQTTTTYPDRSSSSEQDSGDSGSPFVDVRNNASFPSYCGTKIQLVLDRSGSISPFKDDYKAAVDAFITALDNTPTQIAITSFNNDVNSAGTGGIAEQGPLSLSTPGNAATLKAKVAAIYANPQSGTNWDAALRDAAGRGGFGPTPESASSKPDMIVFITDGNPTVSPTDSDSGDVSLLDLTYGMASANLVKNQVVAGAVKMKMFALGVGDGVTVENLKVVSGPNDDSSADPDYAATSILALTTKLKEIAGRSCGARIVVRKKLVGAGDDTTPRSNWNFAATSGASVSYSDPDNAAPYKTSGSPAQMTVSVNAIPAGGTNVAVTEDAAGQPLAAGDYGLTGVVCETGQFGSGNIRTTTSVERGFSISGVLLKRNTDLFCTFTNSILQPNVTLTKTTSTPTVNAGDVAKFAVKVQNTGDGPAQNVVVSDILPAGPTWTADGALPAGCVIANVVVASVTRQKVTCTLASLAKDASVTFNVKATTSAAECGTYDNTVTAIAGNQAQIGPDSESVTCLKPPKLIVIKHVVNDNGGTRTAADFTLQIDDPGTDPPDVTGAESPGTPVTVDAGTYSVTEAAQTGYAVAYSADCKNTTIAFGQTKTCTVTNNDIAPTVKVVKVVTNDNGGTAVPADWQLHLKSGGSDVSGSPKSGKTAGDTYTVAQGAYAVSETGGPSGYAATFSGDCNASGAISVTVGQDKTCTITNNDIAPTVKVVKVVVNDNGGTAVPADWQLHLKSGGSDVSGSPKSGKTLGDTYTVAQGAYAVSETGGPSGYAATFSGDCNASGAISVTVGQDKTCTITNNDIAPTVKVVKVVVNDNGGTAVPADWQLHLKSGGSDVSGSPKSGKTAGDTYTVSQGAYAVSETGGPAGYAATFSGDCNASGAISVTVGQDKTCTITNNDIAPTVRVVKVVVNDNGGTAVPADWQLHLKSGGSDVSGSPKSGKTLGDTYTVAQGAYAVSETGGSGGYAATFSGDCNASGAISVTVGQDKTCTITNNDIAPTVQVRKVVINNNGGTAVPADWQLHLKSGGSDVSGSPTTGKTLGDTYTVAQGAYAVSETGGPAGYAATFSGDCNASGAISVTVGQAKTCTITNDDIGATLNVVKVVTNDNGGTKTPSQFQLTVHEDDVALPSFPGASAPGTAVGMDPGPYSVTEGAHDGYADSYSPDCTATIALGETKTCTVTNNDIAPTVKVVKVVTNDNGGTAVPADWQLHLKSGGTDVSGSPKSGKTAGDTYTVSQGAYAVSETGGPAGYAATFSGDCNANGAISVTVGQDKTCTITNNDVAATVQVRKVVVNDNGGTAVPADWQLHLKSGGSDVAGSPKSGRTAGDTYTVSQGAYAVSETGGPSGYAATFSGDCNANGAISVTVGQDKTCTITNNDIAPTLTVVKHVVNKHGSTATAADFSMQITGTAGTPAPFGGSEAGVTKTLAAGTYAVTESGAATADYTQSDSADCSGSLSVGDEKTCTITNTRKTGTITVVKDLIPATDDGRFDLLVDDTVVKADAADGGSGSLEVNTGTHTVSEAAGSVGSLGNYATGISCNNDESGPVAGPRQISVASGAQIICTITNRRVLAQPVVVKAGDTFTYHGDTVSYTFAVSNTGNSPLHDVQVSDDKCPTVSSAPTSKSNDNGDALLDPIGPNGTSPEVWVFTCSYQMGDHASGEANPVVNTATVTATDELDRPVTDTDRHSTTLLHPAIALTKTGPAAATAGTRVTYLITASNTGDVAFPAALVVVSDARCEAPPMLIGKGADASTATFDPGDTWLYACAVQTVLGEQAIHNVAAVDGTDVNGRNATAQAVADTLLNDPPAAVLGSGDPVLAPASAKLRGPTGCIPQTGRIVVTGKRIAQVTFTVDGKRKKVVKKADSSGRFVYTVAKSKLRTGTHRVRARVVYLVGSTATAKTLVMTLNKCPRAAVKPAFTG